MRYINRRFTYLLTYSVVSRANKAADVAKLRLLNKRRLTQILPCGVYGDAPTYP